MLQGPKERRALKLPISLGRSRRTLNLTVLEETSFVWRNRSGGPRTRRPGNHVSPNTHRYRRRSDIDGLEHTSALHQPVNIIGPTYYSCFKT
jgi:hypothetical protein